MYIILQYLRILQYSSKTAEKLCSQTPPYLCDANSRVDLLRVCLYLFNHYCIIYAGSG
jgi:hypothetical protein